MRTLNLATYYLLPMVELSKSSFGDAGDINTKTRSLIITDKSNFIDCYLSTENYIVVKVRDFSKVPQESLANHYYFTDVEVTEGNGEVVTLILYRVEKAYLDDLAKFRAGKYSQMREIVKDRIVIFNDWDSKEHKERNSLLAVLYQTSWLKKKLEHEWDFDIPDGAELKSVPDESNFIDLSASFKEVSTL